MKRSLTAAIALALVLSPNISARTKKAASCAGMEEELRKLGHKWLDTERLLDVDYNPSGRIN